MMVSFTRSITDTMHELSVLGLVSKAKVSVRVHSGTQFFKLYLINQDDAFFGYYPIRPNKVVAQGEAIEIYDLVGADATLFHCSMNEGESSSGAQQVSQARMWFDRSLGDKAYGTDDPLEVLRPAPQGGEAASRRVEDELTEAEGSAVRTAGLPVSGAVAALEAAHASGRKVAIVSNNSAACVRTFLLLHGLQHLVDAVVGRASYQPEAMKPAPGSIADALGPP
ncbi:HAD hydrolase-like protein [Streptomyces sp. NPDC059452]|uniref:HAD hydrolase-like protein n=1 Tax=Streptomyces sp. NPDC059452 TaxID=3346835 RepID=UPI0036D05805